MFIALGVWKRMVCWMSLLHKLVISMPTVLSKIPKTCINSCVSSFEIVIVISTCGGRMS